MGRAMWGHLYPELPGFDLRGDLGRRFLVGVVFSLRRSGNSLLVAH